MYGHQGLSITNQDQRLRAKVQVQCYKTGFLFIKSPYQRLFKIFCLLDESSIKNIPIENTAVQTSQYVSVLLVQKPLLLCDPGLSCVTCVPVGTVQAGKLNVVLPGISPVYAVIDEVQSQSIGPGDLILDDDCSVVAIHPNSPNVRVITPVRPVKVSKEDKNQPILSFKEHKNKR